MLRRRIQDEVEAELETETSLLRESSPFLRVKVHSIDPRDACHESGLLTIWHPTAEQLSLLKEGSAVQIFDLAVRHSLFDGYIQLKANQRTVIEHFSIHISSIVDRIGYTERRFLTMLEVHKLAHAACTKAGTQPEHVDVDTAVVIVHIHEPSNTQEQTILFVTDETNLILRVQCKSLPHSLNVLLSGKPKHSCAFALCDLRLLGFDSFQQCAVAEFTDLSSVIASNDRVEDLTAWVSQLTNSDLSHIAACLKAGLPRFEQNGDTRVAVGYIIGLRADATSDVLYVQVDCCGFAFYEWELPFPVLERMLSTVSSQIQNASRSSSEEVIAKGLGALESIFRARGMVWKFHILLKPTTAGQNQHIVSQADLADDTLIAQIYLTLPEPGISSSRGQPE